ncbi:undecaprenyl-diphosphatase [Hypnocyclicus thermotrophus]|uniref:Undecaprenyl-diphosphatase n=1 Tax=Hypnocyclicus thermotrophus TaxID=1627895 RepID=A0AA46I5A1_9FUSO|nr:glycosyltransferase family 39 protein [Hypnocyclicus thermotrophus]TDT69108.1 undecaprenyl-diphosphatase [Hypnocyclicus thermotrophus]
MFEKILKKNRVLIVLLIFFIIRLIWGTVLNLTDDEAYYWMWSNHLGISYYDHPPMIAYFIKIFTLIFGNNNFAVRLPANIGILIVSLLIYKISIYLFYDKKRAFWSVILFNIIPLFALAGIMSLPDTPLLIFYTLSLYIFIKIIKEKKEKYWYLLGIVVGLGLISKYNMFMVYPAIFFYLIFDKEERFWFTKKEVYLGFVLSLLLFLPVIIWNIQHDFISFSFHLVERQKKVYKFRPYLFSQFLFGQIAIVSPIIFVGLFKESIKNFNKKYVKLLIFYALPLVAIFTISSFSNPSKVHWLATAYIPLLIVYTHSVNLRKKSFNIGWKTALGLSLIIYIHLIYPILPIPEKDDITTDMYGWDKVGKIVQNMYTDKNNWFIFGSRYQTASQLYFYLPNKDYVYSLNKKIEQFDFLQNEKNLIGKNGIFIAHSFYNDDPRGIYDFDKVKLIKTIDIKRKNKVYRTFYIYKCYNYKGLK